MVTREDIKRIPEIACQARFYSFKINLRWNFQHYHEFGQACYYRSHAYDLKIYHNSYTNLVKVGFTYLVEKYHPPTTNHSTGAWREIY